MKKVVVFAVALIFSAFAAAQDLERAFQYFDNEQFELAAKEFEAALPELRDYYGENDTSVYTQYIFYSAVSCYYSGQYEKAEKYFKEGKRIFVKKKQIHGNMYNNFLEGLVELYLSTDNFQKIDELFENHLKLIRKASGKESANYVDGLNKYSYQVSRYNNLKKAISILNEAEEIGKNLGVYHPSHLLTLSNLSQIHKLNKSYSKAIEIGEKVVEIYRSYGLTENPSFCVPLHNLSCLYRDIGLFEQALPLALESLGNAKKNHEEKNMNYGVKINNLASIYLYLGMYDKAIPLLEEDIEISLDNKGKQSIEYGMALNNLSMMYIEVGQYEKSINLCFEALNNVELNRGKASYDYGVQLSNLAHIYSIIGNSQGAIECLNFALTNTEIKNYENDLTLWSLKNQISLLYSESGQCDTAKKIIEKNLLMSEQKFGKTSGTYRNAINYQVTILSNCKDYEQALIAAQNALEVNQKISVRENYEKESLHFTVALLEMRMGKYLDVRNGFNLSNDLIIAQLKESFSIFSEKEKSQYLRILSYRFNIIKSYQIFYHKLLPVLSSDAFNLDLSTKGMIMESGIQSRQAILNSNNQDALAKYDEWMVIRSSLAKQYTLPLAQRSEDLKDLELRAEKLESELNRLSSTFKQAQSIGSIKWQDVQQQLGDNEVAIEFSSFPYYNGKQWTDSVLYTANVLRPSDEFPHLVYLCEQRQLDSLLYQQGNTEPGFVASLYRGAEIIKTSMPSNGQRLYELIWKPIAHLLTEGGTVFFAPSGSLHQIAHAAIPVDENTLLSDKYKLVQLSTTAALLQDDDRNETLTGEIALFGGIEYNIEADELIALSGQHQDIVYQHTQRGIPAGLERSTEAWSYLPGTLTEVEAIGKLAVKKGVGLKSYTGKDALEERFKELSGNKSPYILHIATHAFFFPDPEKELKNENFLLMGGQQQFFRASDNPLNRAGLLFAGANHTWQGDTVPEGVDDGILTAWEATNLTLANTRLVTLSACETGLGEVHGSEGVFGLQRAFKAAGAGYLLMSLWKVPDTETAEFMAFFYDRLFEGTTITDAFHATQHHMKTQYPTEPYKWAAFVLTR